jgi:hypothetical protein
MDIQTDDNIYVIAIRARGDDDGRSLRAVLDRVGRDIHGNDEYYAQVVAMKLEDAYRVEDAPRSVLNQNDTLRVLGFDFDTANQIVPVVTETAADV